LDGDQPNASSISFQKVRTFWIARATPQQVHFVGDELVIIDATDLRYIF
jgi:hypothetical protein